MDERTTMTSYSASTMDKGEYVISARASEWRTKDISESFWEGEFEGVDFAFFSENVGFVGFDGGEPMGVRGQWETVGRREGLLPLFAICDFGDEFAS